jgi:hypothetical protein
VDFLLYHVLALHFNVPLNLDSIAFSLDSVRTWLTTDPTTDPTNTTSNSSIIFRFFHFSDTLQTYTLPVPTYGFAKLATDSNSVDFKFALTIPALSFSLDCRDSTPSLTNALVLVIDPIHFSFSALTPSLLALAIVNVSLYNVAADTVNDYVQDLPTMSDSYPTLMQMVMASVLNSTYTKSGLYFNSLNQFSLSCGLVSVNNRTILDGWFGQRKFYIPRVEQEPAMSDTAHHVDARGGSMLSTHRQTRYNNNTLYNNMLMRLQMEDEHGYRVDLFSLAFNLSGDADQVSANLGLLYNVSNPVVDFTASITVNLVAKKWLLASIFLLQFYPDTMAEKWTVAQFGTWGTNGGVSSQVSTVVNRRVANSMQLFCNASLSFFVDTQCSYGFVELQVPNIDSTYFLQGSAAFQRYSDIFAFNVSTIWSAPDGLTSGFLKSTTVYNTANGVAVNTAVILLLENQNGVFVNWSAPNCFVLNVDTNTDTWILSSTGFEAVSASRFELGNSGTWEFVQGDKFITSALTLFITSGGNVIVSVAAPRLLQVSITNIDTWILSSTVSEAVSASRFELGNSGTWEVVQGVSITSDLKLFITSGGNAIVNVAAPGLLQLSIDTPTLTKSWSLRSALREQVSGISTGFVNTGN